MIGQTCDCQLRKLEPATFLKQRIRENWNPANKTRLQYVYHVGEPVAKAGHLKHSHLQLVANLQRVHLARSVWWLNPGSCSEFHSPNSLTQLTNCLHFNIIQTNYSMYSILKCQTYETSIKTDI